MLNGNEFNLHLIPQDRNSLSVMQTFMLSSQSVQGGNGQESGAYRAVVCVHATNWGTH